MGKNTTMTIRELRSALAPMHPESTVQVVLFKHDGTSEVFELEEVLHNHDLGGGQILCEARARV